MKVGWARGRAKDFKMTPLRGHGGYITCVALFRGNIVSGGSDGMYGKGFLLLSTIDLL
jgi:hypothetical protein